MSRNTRAGGGGEGVRVQVEVALVGQAEQPQQVDRVGLECLRPVDVQSAALFMETFVQLLALGPPARQQPREALGLGLDPLGLQLGGEHPGQGPDLLGDQEVAAHEPLHRGGVTAVSVAHPPRQFRLQVEGQPLLGPPGGEMQMAAHRPEEVEGADEGGDLAPLEHLELQHALDPLGLGRVQVLADPEQGVEVAQAPLPLLDVGFDHVARGAGPRVAVVSLLQLSGDELGPGALHHLGAEPALELLGQLLVAGEPAGLQDGGADGVVLAGQLDALVDGSRGVADFEPEVPQGVEHVLDHLLHVGRLLVGPQEQEIDVGEGRERAAPVAAHRHQRQPLALRRVAGAEHVHGGEVVEGGDHLVGDARQEPGGLDAAGPGLQPLLGDHPAAERPRRRSPPARRRTAASAASPRRRRIRGGSGEGAGASGGFRTGTLR
jgi:hypothetical protein